MKGFSRSRSAYAVAALLAFSILAPAGSASAQQAPPDIRGTYPVSGGVSVYGCTFEGGPDIDNTEPIQMFFSVPNQDGDAFTGTLGFPDQQVFIFNLSGHVSAGGLVEGTWEFADATPGQYETFDRTFTGEIADGKVSLELLATIGTEGITCGYRVSVSTEAVILTWIVPDPTVPGNSPPRQLQALPFSLPGGNGKSAPPAAPSVAREGQPTGYNIYRSSTPGVQPTPDNLYTSVPPTQTSVPAPDGTSGSFFVVTATYGTGESDPSNEVSGGVPAATLTTVNVKGPKLVAKGKDFSNPVSVFVDGIPFVATARVKGSTKVVQKGNLLNGQSIPQYFTSGRTVTITYRNANGGVATKILTVP